MDLSNIKEALMPLFNMIGDIELTAINGLITLVVIETLMVLLRGRKIKKLKDEVKMMRMTIKAKEDVVASLKEVNAMHRKDREKFEMKLSG